MSGEVRLGTQGWNYPDWVGPFYPEGTRPAEFLTTYAQAFRTVEVDSTFYAVPPARSVRGWASRTPADFVFALKFPQEITHERRLRGAEEVTRDFLRVTAELGPKRGPLLLQMGPDFVPSELGALEAFLPLLPPGVRVAVEVRHERWTRDDVLPELLDVLRAHRRALALSDGRWIGRETMQALALAPTADFHYVRWMGPNRDITAFSRVLHDRTDELSGWAEVLGRASLAGVRVYGYVNNHFAGHSPDSVRTLQAMLGQKPVPPTEMGEQISLF